MKKIILLLAIFLSCKKEATKMEILQTKVEDSLKKDLNNPDSFELSSFKITDTIYTLDVYNNFKKSHLDSKKHNEELIISYQKYADNYRKYIKKYPQQKNSLEPKALEMEEKVEEFKSEIDADLKFIKKLDSLISTIKNETEILQINGLFKFRTLNSFNAKVLMTYKITFNDSLEILEIVELKE